jgi:hypothetical protein
LNDTAATGKGVRGCPLLDNNLSLSSSKSKVETLNQVNSKQTIYAIIAPLAKIHGGYTRLQKLAAKNMDLINHLRVPITVFRNTLNTEVRVSRNKRVADRIKNSHMNLGSESSRVEYKAHGSTGLAARDYRGNNRQTSGKCKFKLI